MSMYSYRAINEQGQSRKGVQDAANLIDLEFRLKRGGLDLIDAKIDTRKSLIQRKKIKRADLITFFFKATLIKSTHSTGRAL
ncbi:MAG: hypothetical protein HKM00_07585 [Gallionella sp.]|nr:hypothetical protein [Gallionella sp.]